jgi:putative transcriptional regulator
MKVVRSNLEVLIAQKKQRDGRRITLRSVAQELDISRYTIYAFANNQLDEYPRPVIEKLCNYFGCDVGDLLTMVEAPDSPQD